MASPEDEHVQITKDGVIDTIYNGIPDWVYEEEILSSNKAMYFSPGGSRMAFVQFNDTEVEEFFYTNYGDPSDPLAHQYPEQVMLKYPKVGTTNPTVKLFVNNLNQNNLPVIPPREVLDYDEHIVTAATWISEDELSVIWSNRVQNESRFVICCNERCHLTHWSRNYFQRIQMCPRKPRMAMHHSGSTHASQRLA